MPTGSAHVDRHAPMFYVTYPRGEGRRTVDRHARPGHTKPFAYHTMGPFGLRAFRSSSWDRRPSLAGRSFGGRARPGGASPAAGPRRAAVRPVGVGVAQRQTHGHHHAVERRGAGGEGPRRCPRVYARDPLSSTEFEGRSARTTGARSGALVPLAHPRILRLRAASAATPLRDTHPIRES